MRFLLTPSTSYSVDYGPEVVRVQLDGGAGRYRRDFFQASSFVACRWVLDEEKYDYAMAFYRTETQRGSLPFQIMLLIDDSTLVEKTVYIMPETWKLSAQQGFSYTIEATLEVINEINPTEETDDDTIIDDYNTSQGYSP